MKFFQEWILINWNYNYFGVFRVMKRNRIISVLFIVLIFAVFIGMFFNAETVAKNVYYGVIEPKDKSVFGAVKGFISGTESGVEKGVFIRSEMIDLNGLFSSIINKKYMQDADPENHIYKLDNGQLTLRYDYTNTASSVAAYREFAESLKSDTKLLYVMPPVKSSKENASLPVSIEDYCDVMADEYLIGLKESGLEYVDLREYSAQLADNYSEIFFNTDHHWKPESAFQAFKIIGKQLDLEHKPDEIVFDDNAYNFDTIQENFLGSSGKRVGRYYGGMDDFTYISPKYDTDMSITIKTQEDKIIEREGNFTDCVFFEEYFKYYPDASANKYFTYLGDNQPLINVVNHSVNKGRALIIEDSYGLPLSPFLSLLFRKTDIVDLRYYTDHTVKEMCEIYDYDYIFVIYNQTSLREDRKDELFYFG